MRHPRTLAAVALVGLSVVSFVSPASGDHANARRWRAQTDVTRVLVVDRTGDPAWHAATQKAVQDWNAANTTLRLSWTSGAGACGFEAHTINVCMGYANGYYGQATYQWDSTGYLSGARVVFDSTLTANYNIFSRNYLACHEIGHNLVVDHSTDAGSCMGSPDVDHPGTHDYEALRSTYGSWSAPTTATPTTTTTTVAPTTTTTTMAPATTTTTTTTTVKQCRARHCR